jgi:hypothetical protein
VVPGAARSRPAGEVRTVVLGLGNPILSDDAVGLAVAGDLERRLAVEPLPGVGWRPARGSFELIDLLAVSTARSWWIADIGRSRPRTDPAPRLDDVSGAPGWCATSSTSAPRSSWPDGWPSRCRGRRHHAVKPADDYVLEGSRRRWLPPPVGRPIWAERGSRRKADRNLGIMVFTSVAKRGFDRKGRG